MIRLKFFLAAFIALGLSGFSQGADNEPPAGFVALFNGKDLAGWHGYDTKDPRKFQEMPADQQQATREKSLEDIKKHWTIQGADLVNDGNGLYLTTDKNYGDYELWIDYKTVPKADSAFTGSPTGAPALFDLRVDTGHAKFTCPTKSCKNATLCASRLNICN